MYQENDFHGSSLCITKFLFYQSKVNQWGLLVKLAAWCPLTMAACHLVARNELLPGCLTAPHREHTLHCTLQYQLYNKQCSVYYTVQWSIGATAGEVNSTTFLWPRRSAVWYSDGLLTLTIHQWGVFTGWQAWSPVHWSAGLSKQQLPWKDVGLKGLGETARNCLLLLPSFAWVQYMSWANTIDKGGRGAYTKEMKK